MYISAISTGKRRARGHPRGGDGEGAEEPRVPLADEDRLAGEPRAVDNDVDKPADEQLMPLVPAQQRISFKNLLKDFVV